MLNNKRRVTLLLGAIAAGGLLAATYLSMALAYADEYDFAPVVGSFNPEQVELGYPPLVNVVTGTDAWSPTDLTTGVATNAEFLNGTDIETTIGTFTNDDFLLEPNETANIGSVVIEPGTQLDLANFGGGFENEWIDIPGGGSGSGVSDLLITPLGDVPLIGSFFADLSSAF
jgi:hypothetical protein